MANPYEQLIGVMRTEGAKYNPSVFSIGKVISLEPLQISLGKLPLNKNNLLINTMLLEHNRDFKLPTTTITSDNNLNSIEIESGTVKLKTKLKVGSLVIVYPIEDNQKYIVFCEVV